jgi:galactonate dehydratase
MKITGVRVLEIEASRRGSWILVEVRTDSGLTGIGEASQSGNDRLVRESLLQLGERLAGADPTQPEVIWERLTRSSDIFADGAGRVAATAVSAVDQALWDIAGKALEVPVWRLLGGRRRERVRLYANLNRGTRDRSVEGFARAARAAVEAGFRAVKCTPFDEIRHDRLDRDGVEEDLDLGVARIAASREAVGPGVDLLVDCHCRFNLALARKAAEKVRGLDLYWFEEPLPRDQVGEMRSLRESSGLTLAGGEGFFGREGFWEYLSQGAVDVIMPDVKHAGGISECRRIAALAETRNIPVAPHSPAGPVSTIAGVHLAASIRNFLILEYAFGEVPWREQLISPPERVEGGFMPLPEGPGLGVELNQEIVQEHLEWEGIS